MMILAQIVEICLAMISFFNSLYQISIEYGDQILRREGECAAIFII